MADGPSRLRRAGPAGVAVNVTISMANASAAQAASGMLTQASINAALQAVGLPQVPWPLAISSLGPHPHSHGPRERINTGRECSGLALPDWHYQS
jgi:hypothetical protein